MVEDVKPLVGRRATIAFTVRATTELDWLMSHVQLKQVDVVNRAVSVYGLVEREVDKGKKMAFISEDGTVEIVSIVG
ncbi:hypothetical protein SEA_FRANKENWEENIE_17 [Streptomyces phage Frankenweenie]|nr:hypothetical protein SEA_FRANKENWEENIE_17 [Streptomyces phage Frankenweenie]